MPGTSRLKSSFPYIGAEALSEGDLLVYNNKEGRFEPISIANLFGIGAPISARIQAETDGLTVALDGSMSTADDGAEIASYRWHFGDGTSAEGSSPERTYRYERHGVFMVTLTVTDTLGRVARDSVLVPISPVGFEPTAVAQVASIEGRAVSFDGSGSTPSTGGGPLDYAWTFLLDGEQDGTASGVSPTHTFSGDGEAQAVLTVTEGEDTDSDTAAVTLDTTAPSVSIALANPSGHVARVTLVSDEASGGDASDIDVSLAGQTLDGGDFSGDPLTATVDLAENGEYTATLNTFRDEAGNDGGRGQQGSVAIYVEVDPPTPVAQVSSVDGRTVAFDGTGTTPGPEGGEITYEWEFYLGGALDGTASGAAPTYAFSGDGEAQGVLTVSHENSPEASDTASVTLDATAPSVSLALDNPFDQVARVTLISDEAPGESDSDVLVSLAGQTLNGGDFSGDPLTASVDLGLNGTFTATLETFRDEQGNDGASGQSDSVTISYVIPAPTAVAEIASVEGRTVRFDASETVPAPEGGEITYAWAFLLDGEQDGTASGVSPTHTFSGDGEAEAVLTAYHEGGAEDTDSVSVTLDTTAPSVSIALANPSGHVARVTLVSDEASGGDASDIDVSLAGQTLDGNDFSGDPLTATVDLGEDGEYTATLNTFRDEAGNDGGDGQQDSVTIDTAAPVPTNFDVAITQEPSAAGAATYNFESGLGGWVDHTNGAYDFSDNLPPGVSGRSVVLNTNAESNEDLMSLDVGGRQPSSIRFHYNESSNSNGGGIYLYDENGNAFVQAGTSNPDWEARIGGNALDLSGNASYNTWVEVEVALDWSAGEATVTMTDLSDGERSTVSGSFSASGLSKIAINNGGAIDGQPNTVMYVAGFRLEGAGESAQPGIATVSFDCAAPDLAAVTANVTGLVTGQFGLSAFTQEGDTYSREVEFEGGGTINASLTQCADAEGNDYFESNDPLAASDTITFDTTAPSVSVALDNPSQQVARVTLLSDEAPGGKDSDIRVLLAGQALTGDDFSGDPLTATVDLGEDGEYTATLNTFRDADGNDGGDGQTATVVIDTTPPEGTVPDQTMIAGVPLEIDLLDHISDPEGDTLTFSDLIFEDNDGTATLLTDGHTVRIESTDTNIDTGDGEVSGTVSDGVNERSFGFMVAVKEAPTNETIYLTDSTGNRLAAASGDLLTVAS